MESLVALVGVKAALEEPDFFAFLSQLNVDSALDLRDDSQFDERWMCEFNAVQ
ncbi:hypothetical protein P2Q74_00365 [Escherichia coli]|nr:hypothetical protein [Escherichia sp. MOD1-EC5189]EIY7825749.1 hypothetical protein [Escherichia coli]